MITYDNITEYIDAGKTPSEILAELQSQVNIVENKTAWTIGLMQSEIGPDLTYMIAEIIKNAGETNPVIYSAFIALSTVGLQLYSDDRQAMIEMLGAGRLTAEQIATVKSLGVVSTPKYTDLTEQDVVDCIAAHEAELEQQALEQLRMATWEAWNTAYNNHVSPVLDGDDPSVANLIAGLQAAIAELEA